MKPGGRWFVWAAFAAALAVALAWIPAFAGMTSDTGMTTDTGMTGEADEAKAPSSENLFKGMKWRLVGPFRGGRVLAVAGVPGDPLTYYFGAAGGGVWKSTNGGLDWTPLFDKQPVASIGAIAVAESDPNVV